MINKVKHKPINKAMKTKNYPYWSYPARRVRRLWLRQARKQWVAFNRSLNSSNTNTVFSGCVYYPKPVYEWLNKIKNEAKEMDKIMKDYYRKA